MPRRHRKPLFELDLDGLNPDEVQEHLDFLEATTEAPDPTGWARYRGERVTWLGDRGRMMRVTPDILTATPDNQFYLVQVAATALYMKTGRAVFVAPPALVQYPVDPERVGDTQRAAAREELFVTDGMTRPFSTGEEELDDFLAERTERKKYLEQMMKEAARSPDTLEAKAEMKALDKRVAAAVRAKQGDLGVLTVQLRDGNHRTFAAFAAGEPFVWVNVIGWTTKPKLS